MDNVLQFGEKVDGYDVHKVFNLLSRNKATL